MTEQQAGVEEVPPGYKWTEVGVIPEDWGVEQLLNLLHLPTGQVNPCREPYRSMILVAPDHIEPATGRLLVKETAAEQQAISGKYLFKTGDIVYSKIRPYLRKVILADFDGLCSADMYPLTATRAASPGFMLAVLLGHRFSTFVEAASARSGIPKVNRTELAEYRVALPPLPEQRAIATALSDADGLIVALNALIEKKQAIKQATMQQLLTGKKRLPGFEGEWETKQLYEIADIDPENLLSNTDPTYSFNYISLEQVDNGHLIGYSEEVFSAAPSRARRVLRYGDVLMSTVRPNLMAHLHYREQIRNAVCSTGFSVLRVKHDLADSGFLFAHLFGSFINKQIEKMLAGSNYPAISSRDVKLIEITCPSLLSEQRAIAAVLSDMDAEITALERRREKAKQIKQGMMQQLLTGRIRLVEPPEAAA